MKDRDKKKQLENLEKSVTSYLDGVHGGAGTSGSGSIPFETFPDMGSPTAKRPKKSDGGIVQNPPSVNTEDPA